MEKYLILLEKKKRGKKKKERKKIEKRKRERKKENKAINKTPTRALATQIQHQSSRHV